MAYVALFLTCPIFFDLDEQQEECQEARRKHLFLEGPSSGKYSLLVRIQTISDAP